MNKTIDSPFLINFVGEVGFFHIYLYATQNSNNCALLNGDDNKI